MQGRAPGAPIKYQARVGYKPSGESRVKQRALGVFDTIDGAAAAVAAAEAKLANGVSPWEEPERKHKHKRGEVRHSRHHEMFCGACAHYAHPCAHPRVRQAPPPERKTARRHGVYTTDRSHAKGHPERCRGQEERNPQLPTSVPMPSAVEDISDVGMRAMWEQGEAAAVEAEPLD